MISAGNVSTSGAQVNQSSTTWSHTVLGNLLVVFCTGYDGGALRVATGVTFNGVALTKALETNNGNGTSSIWYLVNPSTGANNIVVTWNGSQDTLVCGAVDFLSASPTQPDNTATGSGSGSPISNNIVAAKAGVVVDCFIYQSTADWTEGAGQVAVFDTLMTGDKRGGASYKLITAPATVTMSWTSNGGSGWGHSLTSFAKGGVPKVMAII